MFRLPSLRHSFQFYSLTAVVLLSIVFLSKMFVVFYKDGEFFDGYSSPFFCNVIGNGNGKSSESAQGSATRIQGGSQLEEAAAIGQTVELTSTMTVTMTLTHTMIPTPTPVTLEKVIEEFEPQYCGYCTSTDEICKRYGSFNLARSRAYDGPNARLKRVLRKLRSGQKIKIGIIGGSVSAGHGLPDHRLNWSYLYAQYIRETFGSENVEVELINGSVGATVSDYMETCFLEHITEDVDLVIIELAINDMRLEKLAMGYENLIRAVFALPNRPAIVNLQIMALMFPAITMGGDLHTAVAQYYDTPIVSVRNVLLPHILRSTELNPTDTSVEDYWYYHNDDGSIDLRHLGITGHRMLADLLISFTSRVACEAWREEQQQQHAPAGSFVGGFDWSPYPDDRLDPDSPTPGTLSLPNPNEGIDVTEYIPRESLFQKFDHTTKLLPARPFCQISAPNAKHPLMPLPQPVSSEGHDASDMSQVPDPSDAFALWSHPGNPGKVWLTGRKPGVKVSFAVKTSSLGRVRVTYLKSESYGLGSVWCWIDADREKGERLDGWWPVENINVAHPQTVAESLSPGDHILTCEILEDTKDPGGGTEFRIVAIDAL